MVKPLLSPRARVVPAPSMGAVLAGARARGLAEGLDWLGLAAVLIDDRGEAMHVTQGAARLLGDALYIEHGRLKARAEVDDARLVAALCDAVALGRPQRLGLDADGLIVHIAPTPAEDHDPDRRLRAVALFRRPAKM